MRVYNHSVVQAMKNVDTSDPLTVEHEGKLRMLSNNVKNVLIELLTKFSVLISNFVRTF